MILKLGIASIGLKNIILKKFIHGVRYTVSYTWDILNINTDGEKKYIQPQNGSWIAR